jgi:hypothetical protein
LSGNHLIRRPSANNEDIDDPVATYIDFPHDRDDVVLLLDFMTKREPPKGDAERYERVLKLCDQHGCDIFVDRIIGRLYTIVKQSPWSVFCIASHLNDIELARMALKHMEQDPDIGKLKLSPISHELASRCALNYFLGLLRCACVQDPHQKYNWKIIAKKFEVVNPVSVSVPAISVGSQLTCPHQGR